MIEDTRCLCGKLPYRHELVAHRLGFWSHRTHADEVKKIYAKEKHPNETQGEAMRFDEVDPVPNNVALPTQGKPERFHLYQWIVAEETYVHEKFKDERGKHDATWAEGFDSFWYGQIEQYFDRAKQFFAAAIEKRAEGDDAGHAAAARHLEMKGQQALAKAVMTAKGCVESSIRTFGNMPAPGVPSGEITESQ